MLSNHFMTWMRVRETSQANVAGEFRPPDPDGIYYATDRLTSIILR